MLEEGGSGTAPDAAAARAELTPHRPEGARRYGHAAQRRAAQSWAARYWMVPGGSGLSRAGQAARCFAWTLLIPPARAVACGLKHNLVISQVIDY
jgi:hypothetical protein